MLRKSILLTVLVTVGPACRPKSEGSSWSEPVNGIQARFTLVTSEVINNTPIISTYLTLRNVSDVANPIRIDWASAEINFAVINEAGNPVPRAIDLIYNGCYVPLSEIVLPHDSTLTFNISRRGLGIPAGKAALIDLGIPDCWILEKTGREKYFLKGTLNITDKGDRGSEYERSWKGRVEIPKIRIPLG
jgi:hypothetical protein